MLYLTSTPDDILNVRLQTLGVKEHSFDISLSGTSVNWLLYDVGGAVSLPFLRRDGSPSVARHFFAFCFRQVQR